MLTATRSMVPEPPTTAALWAFVALVAQSLGHEGTTDVQLRLLASFQQQARALLAAQDDAARSSDGRYADPATLGLPSQIEKKLSEEANERVARQMIDAAVGGVSAADSVDGTSSDAVDRSDTMSDCTTLTETSSVYGIHNTWVDLAMLYSLPFVFYAPSAVDGRRMKPIPALNIAQEQMQLSKIFQECQRAIHTMRAVASVESLRKVLDRGVTVLHFSGHGGQIAGSSSSLVFEDTQCTGLAHFVDAVTLRNVLNGGVSSVDDYQAAPMRRFESEDESASSLMEPPNEPTSTLRSVSSSSSRSMSEGKGMCGSLKLVFVSSCHSRDIGDVFIQAGVAHVVCVRCEGRVLDESSSMFAHSFYHAALAGKTVHQAFEIARVRVSAEMRIPDDEGDKFVLLESSQLHNDSCPLYSQDGASKAIEVDFASKNCTCHAATNHCIFADLSVGKWVDVSPFNKFSKTLPVVPESFVGREQELHMLAELVNTRRFVTLRGPPGIGKSTLSIKLAHFLAERNAFPDGVAFVRLRGVQSLEGMESAIKSALFPEEGREKEMPLHQALSGMKVLLILDNMEDPINANPSAVRESLLHLLQNTPRLAFLMTTRQAIGGGLAGFDEKVVSLNRLSHFHAADLFLKRSPRALLISEIGDIDTSGSNGKSRAASVLDALTAHPLMAFLDGHPQAISLCAPLLQDRSLPELTRIVLSRGVSELQVVGLPAHDRSAVNTLVTSLGVSLEQVKMHHGQDAIRFFALLGLLPAGGMPADFKSLWGPQWEALVETLLRFSLIQRNRIPGFALAKRGLPKRSGVTGTSALGSGSRRHARGSSGSAADRQDHSLLAALKSYGDFISGAGNSSKRDSGEYDAPRSSSITHSDRDMLNTFTRSGRVSRAVEHVEQMDSQSEIMSVCVSYSTFPFITSYARSLLGMYDGDGAKNDALDSICLADRDLFLHNCARHFWKVSVWVFQHICTLTARSSASYLILDTHESNLWMIIDLHIRMIEEWRVEATSPRGSPSGNQDKYASGGADMSSNLSVDCSTTSNLRDRIGCYVSDVACYFAHALFLSGRHRGAWNAANKALHIAKHHKDSLQEANTRKLMGILLTTETKFDEAKAQFGMALILYKAIGDKLGQAASLSAIGMIHSRKGNLRGAHNCFTKALTLYEWFKHLLGQLNCHQRLANLEKKLRDGDGLARKNSQNSGYSHHYAATRRLQGDLNRKRNAEYIVRWVGHEMSLLLELPTSRAEKLQETPFVSSTLSTSASFPASSYGSPKRTTAKSPSPGVTNTPKKCKLGMIIDQKEAERGTVAAAPSSAASAPATTSSDSQQQGDRSSASVHSDKLKNSSFAKRREYDSSIRKGGGAAGLPSSSDAS